MMPGDPLVGGTILRRSAIQSPNFDMAAQTGWAIYANGDAFFWNVTASGDIIATQVIAEGPGAGTFVYYGTPGPGTLVIAIVSQGGTDPYGNEYSGPGIILKPPGTAVGEIQIRPDLSAMLFYA
jgi:hypothetical protein